MREQEADVLDENGYPSEAALDRVRTWPDDDPRGWLAFVRSLWWAADWGWSESEDDEGHWYRFSTGGWSGNESLVSAMQKTMTAEEQYPEWLRTMFGLWARHWYSSRRGGHYELLVPAQRLAKEAGA